MEQVFKIKGVDIIAEWNEIVYSSEEVEQLLKDAVRNPYTLESLLLFRK